MSWVNGVHETLLPISDRAVQFGDGCFTTAKVLNGRVDYLADHLTRLQQNSQQLFLPECDWKQLESEMQAAAEGCELGVLKVMLTRGQGGRGYSALGCSGPTRIMSLSAYPQHYLQWQQQGVRLTLSPVQLSRNPLLAGLKHLNRLEQVMIRQALEQTDADEALVADTAGMLVECCAANIFWREGHRVFTPDLSYSGVAGIMRQRLINLLNASDNFNLEIVSEPVTRLASADEVIICNALMPILPVKQAGNWRYNASELYDFCQQALNK
ncbi:aminodeoxychorismate lyase [Rouxiella sp. Mn2063]|uniref:aminodeoxychorismate lyase n=1 Tax=Rouxiella sp. Mn2063 TaxID=3395262 RepID=UPI003BC31CA8